jgi:hypothetical protein
MIIRLEFVELHVQMMMEVEILFGLTIGSPLSVLPWSISHGKKFLDAAYLVTRPTVLDHP